MAWEMIQYNGLCMWYKPNQTAYLFN